MELKEAICNFQETLHPGYTSVNAGGLFWLNVSYLSLDATLFNTTTSIFYFAVLVLVSKDICGQLTTICKRLHKFLIFDCKANGRIIETTFLCLTQIIGCIKHLEKTIKLEKQHNRVLAVSVVALVA